MPNWIFLGGNNLSHIGIEFGKKPSFNTQHFSWCDSPFKMLTCQIFPYKQSDHQGPNKVEKNWTKTCQISSQQSGRHGPNLLRLRVLPFRIGSWHKPDDHDEIYLWVIRIFWSYLKFVQIDIPMKMNSIIMIYLKDGSLSWVHCSVTPLSFLIHVNRIRDNVAFFPIFVAIKIDSVWQETDIRLAI